MVGGKRIKVVRGGGICGAGEKPALTRGSLKTAVCMSTPGADPRPRWRVAGSNLSSSGSQGSHGTRGSHGATHGHASAAKQRMLRQRSGG
jgi:hypothetical protein